MAKTTVASHNEPKPGSASGFLRKPRAVTPATEWEAEGGVPARIVGLDLSRIPLHPRTGRSELATKPADAAFPRPQAGRVATTRAVQAKLEVGSVDDPLEQEADQVAEKVLRMPDPMAAAAEGPPGLPVTPAGAQVQRRAEPGGEANRSTVSHDAAVPRGGQPLAPSMRAYFEPRFGQSFADVRVHANADAASRARSLGARAYTVGRDIVFGGGAYAPETAEGRRLLAHELAHTVQQAGSAPQVQREPEDAGAPPQNATPPAAWGGMQAKLTGSPSATPQWDKTHQDPNNPVGVNVFGLELSVDGAAIPVGETQDDEYDLGFVQNLVGSAVIAVYTNDAGQTVQTCTYKSDPTPALDNDEKTAVSSRPWVRHNAFISLSKSNGRVSFKDRPNMYYLWKNPADKNRLSSAAGTDIFVTWLVLRKKSTHAMEYLSNVHWSIDWKRTFNFAARTVSVPADGSFCGEPEAGRGSFQPVLSGAVANQSVVVSWDPPA